MATRDVTLKLVVDFTTRRQTGLGQIGNWTAGIEAWSLTEIEALVASSPVPVSIVSTEYDREITDRGRVAGTDERAWQLYPMRTAILSMADGDKAVVRTHLDGYMTGLRDEIQTFIESNRVQHRATVTRWHLHLSTGSIDENL